MIHFTRFLSTPILRSLCLLFCFALVGNAQHVRVAKRAVTQEDLPSSASLAGQWSAVSSWPVVAIHAHLLPNGKVLTWQRLDSQLTTQTHLWDPATNTFEQVFNPFTHLFCSGHSFLPDGKLLVTGGHHFSDGLGEPHTNVFDYKTKTWSRVADMNAGRWYPTNTSLANGEVLVVSGTDLNGHLNTLPQVWRTNNGGGWRSLTSAAGPRLPLYPWMLLAPDGRVFNPGPDQVTRFLNTAGTGTWSEGKTSNFGFRDYGSAVMYDDGKVLIAGGGDPPTNTAEVIDLNAPLPKWRLLNSRMAFARRQMNSTLLPDGKVLVTGGTSGGSFNNAVGSVFAAEMWDPATEQWSRMASMRVRRIYHSTALLLPDGRVLSAGGGLPTGGGGDTNHPDAEIYSPPYLFKGPRPTITSSPTNVNYGWRFFVGTPDSTSITKVTWIRLSSVTHSFNQDQRINRLSFTQTPGGLRITPPSNRNLCPPGHYMLFILNGNGVPSVAKIVRVTPGGLDTAIDFDKDRKADLSVWRPSEGNWYVINSATGQPKVRQWGLPGDIPVPGDYDVDEKTDHAVWRPSEGNWYIVNSSTGQQTVRQYGLPGDIPVPGDYDGDGKIDFAVWRPSQGNWYVLNSSTGQQTIRQWGTNGDKPVAGDYDGDGKTDFAVWRPSQGNWFVINSSTGQHTIRQYGTNGDVTVSSDYDQDGRTDFAVWRPSQGNWFVINSSTGQQTLRQWGLSGDIPVPGDYDGDEKIDFAVWRPSEGNWYIINSSTGQPKVQQWGLSGDIPAPSAYVRR